MMVNAGCIPFQCVVSYGKNCGDGQRGRGTVDCGGPAGQECRKRSRIGEAREQRANKNRRDHTGRLPIERRGRPQRGGFRRR